MIRLAAVVRRSYRRAGRVVPATARRLRGRSVTLGPGEAIGWHSTESREELVIGLRGTARLEWRVRPGRTTSLSVSRGECLFLPARTEHRVVNRSSRMAHYIYLTG